MKKIKQILMTLFCCAALISCFGEYGSVTTKRVTAEEISSGIRLTAEELNSGTTEKNPWKKMFDFWSNAGNTEKNVRYTADGVIIEGTNANNAMNLVNAPMSVSDGARFEMVFGIPIYDGNTGESASQTQYVQKVPLVLFNGNTAIATAYIWGDSYSDERSFVNADFEVGETRVTEVHIPKAVMEVGGGIRIGFNLENGWLCDTIGEETTEYRAVSDAFAEALAEISVQEITRVQATQKWDSATNTKVAVKELNGQSLCLDSDDTLFLNDGYNVSALKTPKDFVFLARETYAFELLGVAASSAECNTLAPRSETAVWAYAYTGIMGDIGWNSDSGKGPCKESGIYMTLIKEDGTTASEAFYGGSWGAEGHSPISFTFGEPGMYKIKVTFITTSGVVTVRTAEVVAQETPHILLDGNLPKSAYIGTNIEIPVGMLVDSDGSTVLVEKTDVSVIFNEELAETTDGIFVITSQGKYTLVWSAEYDGKSYRKSVELQGIIDTLKFIEITQNPEKINYAAGESFECSGMVVTAVYESGKRAEIFDYTVNKDVLRAGDESVVVSYGGKKTVLPISVVSSSDLSSGGGEGKRQGCGSAFFGTSISSASLIALFCLEKKRGSKT